MFGAFRDRAGAARWSGGPSCLAGRLTRFTGGTVEGWGQSAKPYLAVEGLDASSLGPCSVWALGHHWGLPLQAQKRGAVPSCRGRLSAWGHQLPEALESAPFFCFFLPWVLVAGCLDWTVPVTVVLGGPVSPEGDQLSTCSPGISPFLHQPLVPQSFLLSYAAAQP